MFKFIATDKTELSFSKEMFERNDDNSLGYVLTDLDKEAKYACDDCTWNITTKKELDQYLNQYFGISGLSTYPKIEFYGLLYQYDTENQKYVANHEYGIEALYRRGPDYLTVYDIEKNND